MGFVNTIMAGLTNATMAMRNVLLEGDSGSGGFDLLKFLGNATEYLKNVGHYIMVFAGVILVIVAVVQIAKGFASGGRGQVNWVMSIACLLVGGMLIFGGWNLATNIASIGADTIMEMGGAEGMELGADGGGGQIGNSGFQNSAAQ